MSFLNGILLAGAAAFLIPLLIHMLNRRKVSPVPWGAMHLLAEVLKQKKRRFQIEQWLLLAMRIAIPIVLALCLARPVLSSLKSLPGFGKSSVVIVLDDSFSMRAAGSAGPAWDRAREAVVRVTSGLPRGSDVQILLCAGRVHTLFAEPTSSLDLIPKALEEVRAMGGPVDAQQALKTAGAILAKASNGARELIFISDFQGTDWRSFAEGAPLSELSELTALKPAPAVSFFRIDNDLGENLSIANVELSAVEAAETQPVGMRVRVKNHGRRLWQDVALDLECDGAKLRTTRITVPPEGETTLSLSHAFDKVGDHTLGLRLSGDGVNEDNSWQGVVRVRQQVNVLLVDGRPSDVPLAGSADFVELSLAPHLAAAAGIKDLVVTSTVEDNRLREADLRGKEVVVLCNIDRINRTSDLERFVDQGGGLLIFAGDRCDPKRFNAELWKAGKGLLPAEIKSMDHADGEGLDARISLQRYTHPALTYFNDARAGRLSDASFRSWWKLDATAEGAKPMLTLDRGSAIMVEKPFGKGKVILAGFSAEAAWTNLPLQVVWVPLMQRVVGYLATKGTGENSSRVGEPVRLGLEDGRSDATYVLTDPLGVATEIKSRKEESGATVESAPVDAPGVYEMKRKDGSEARKFAFNVDATESSLAPLNGQEVNALGQRVGAEVVDSIDGYQRLDRSRRFGAELWQMVLAVLVVLLFAEVLLEQRIGRA